MSRIFAFLLIIAFAAACSPKVKPGTSDQNDKVKTINDMPSDEIYETYVGLYREHHGKLEFIPCYDAAKKYWIIGETDELSELYASAIQQGFEGQSVVAAVKGKLKKAKPSKGAAMASPYDAQLKVQGVIKVRPKNFRNTCVPFDFWALGNEPYWTLQISEKEDIIEYSQLGEETVHTAYVKPTLESEGKVSRYRFNFPNGQRMKVRITEEKCSDSMSGNSYDYQVEVNYKGRDYIGCATKPKG